MKEHLTVHTNDAMLTNFANACMRTKNRIVHHNPDTNTFEAKVVSVRQLCYAYATANRKADIIKYYISNNKKAQPEDVKIASSMVDSYISTLGSIQLSILNILYANPTIKVDGLSYNLDTATITIDDVTVLTKYTKQGVENA